MDSRTSQQNTLSELLYEAKDTEFGRRYNFREINSYEEFRERIPIHFYADLVEYINKLKQGTADVLWPGTVTSFAVSAGTTGAGKHLPLSEDRLKSDKVFMRKVAFSYLRQRPNVFTLLGSHVSLPGSIKQTTGFRLGEISGFTAQSVPFWLSPFQLIAPEKLTDISFREKFEKVVSCALKANVTVITAVPSWTLTLFQGVLKRSGKEHIAEVWPNLQLLVCGGVKLSNYRPHLKQLAGMPDLDFIETYGASEGYFAYTDKLERDDLRLVTNNGIFYEFIPHPLPDEQSLSIQDTLPLSDVKTGIPYGVLVSTDAGLWRYALRDVIEFTSVDPPRIIVKGRVSEMLDDFGEGVYIYEAEEAVQTVARDMGLQIGAFTIASRLDSENEIPRHHWYVQFFEPVHSDTLLRMAGKVDLYLQNINRHYAIRRESEALGVPHIRSITQAQINNWLEENDKDKAQGKLPRVLPKEADLTPFV